MLQFFYSKAPNGGCLKKKEEKTPNKQNAKHDRKTPPILLQAQE